MTNTKSTQKDESGDIFSDVSIADLRRYAKMMNITAQRDWDTDDYIAAIKAQTEAAKFTRAEGSTSLLPPGHARLTIFKDPTPGHSNSSLPLGLNGRHFIAPRGVEVVMPLEYVAVLADAKSVYSKQKPESASLDNPMGEVVEETIQSYPFQVHEIRPHENGSQFTSQYDQRGAKYYRRVACREAIGKWPTDGELLEYEKEQRAAASVDRHLAMKS